MVDVMDLPADYWDRIVIVGDSSQISKLSYNTARRQLLVEFSNGDVYRYYRVSSIAFGSLVCADSVGKYFNTIRNQFTYEKET